MTWLPIEIAELLASTHACLIKASSGGYSNTITTGLSDAHGDSEPYNIADNTGVYLLDGDS